ncbi:hypothetical protein FGG08_002284 [Glutinoglossum americanum]|uniref:Flavodoxin domain-containing protein n=1 Tax=Glutinoglossum americanum TaxID=1670608 RepID=A0A9P8L1W2_9PEZI|nr:hypothetical protein FGG08_002284 [Glutinoglossum americanum]
MKILVAYASAQGSTKEIAERISTRIPPSIGSTDCRTIGGIGQVNDYDAIIVGSAIHSGAWLPEATDFIHKHSEALSKRPLWAFSVGMADALPSIFRKKGAELEEAKMADAVSHDVHPKSHKLFSGVVQPELMPGILRTIFRVFGGRFGDLRDWSDIEKWVDEEIVGDLKGDGSAQVDVNA